MLGKNITIPRKKLEVLCQKWNIKTLELFGSVTRGDFSKKSDVDVLVTFESGQTPGIEFIDLKEELETLFKRRVDLLTRPSIERSRNRFRKASILGSAKVIYEKAAA